MTEQIYDSSMNQQLSHSSNGAVPGCDANNAFLSDTEHMQVLLAITDSTLAHVTLEDLLHEMLHRIRGIMKADNIAVLLLDKDMRSLSIRAVDGLETDVAPQVCIPIGKGFAGRIANECRPLLLQNPSADEVMTQVLREHMKSLLGVPLIMQEHVLGVLHIGMKEPRYFTSSDVQLLQRVADRLALAIDRTAIYEKEREARQEAATRAMQLEAILASIGDCVFITDQDGRIVYMNDATRAILPAAEQGDPTLLSDEGRYSWLDACDEHGLPFPVGQGPIERVLRGELLKGNNSVDIVVRSGEPQAMQLNVSAVPIQDKDGDIIGAVCIGRDVTERRYEELRIREGLRSLLATAQLLVQAAPASRFLAAQIAYGIVDVIRLVLGCRCVGLVTVEGDALVVHPVAESGFSGEQTLAWYTSMVQSPSGLLDILASTSVRERLLNNETIILEPTSEMFLEASLPSILLITSIQVEQPLISMLYVDRREFTQPISPEALAMVEALTKISALTIERERREYERQQLVASLEEANAQLEHMFKMQKAFVAVVSHEFRTTLTGIQGFSELLKSEELSPAEVNEYATDIHSDALRLSEVINRFLDLEYMKSGQLALKSGMVDLNTIAQAVIAQAQQYAHKHRFLLVLDESIQTIVGDQERLQQVLDNLISNAVKYSPSGGEILLRSNREGEYIHISVQDQGVGIPAQSLQDIFDPFSYIHSERTRYVEGTGLGLPLVKQIVEMHHGQIWAESTQGEGSCFHLVLPIRINKPE